MRFFRLPREELVDSLLTLALFQLAAPEGYVGDRLKAAKLLFVPCYQMFQRRLKGFNFSFYRYTWGPFTKELYETWEDLGWTGLLEVGVGAQGRIRLTDEGHDLARRFVEEVIDAPVNQGFSTILHEAADKIGSLPTNQLLKRVYAMKVTCIGFPGETTVGTCPMGIQFTAPLEERLAQAALSISDDWVHAFDRSRQKAQAATAGRPEVAEDRILDDLREAIAADDRGEGIRLGADEIEDIKRRYGVS